MPDVLRDRPAAWRQHLDKLFEPKLTAEQQAENEAAEAERQAKLKAEKWASWGTSPEQLASQARMMAMAGPEG